MQLAASQRAHPPPVPPRPSRQVVAEALKKSPRPPCPTRQAPPPPNQRPWRLEEQKPAENSAGRTIVYDSAVIPPAVEPRSNKPPEVQARKLLGDAAKRPVSRDLSKEVSFANGKLDHKEEHRKIEDTSKRKEEESNNSIVNNNNNNNEEEENHKDQCDSPAKEEEVICRKKKCQNVSFKEEEPSAPVVVERSNSSRSSISTSSSTKSLENCATVVVIDEEENAHISHNGSLQEDHDYNIQRQDWLEAGVRYSSTKIVLPGEEVVVNGFSSTSKPQQQQQQQQQREENGEEEEEEGENQLEFADLDFSR